jgi:phage FluMu protein Com
VTGMVTKKETKLRCAVCDRLLAEHAPTGTVIVCRTCKTRNVQK